MGKKRITYTQGSFKPTQAPPQVILSLSGAAALVVLFIVAISKLIVG